MTDEFDQQAAAQTEPAADQAPYPDPTSAPGPSDEQVVEAYLGADVEGIAATDTSIAASLPSVDDINFDNAEKAAKWAYRKLFGHSDPPPEPQAPVIDIEDHEETSTRSTWVEHEDPPPPPPPAEHPAPHEAPKR